jgi:3-hydroxyisobutyrate dehydrogenase-like beta-hydroxyacid dehydrogenase
LGESLGIERTRLAEVLNGGSATSKALGSIAVFGGTLDQLAPIAGALLQKDVRHAASVAAAASVPEGAVFDAADAALRSMEFPR